MTEKRLGVLMHLDLLHPETVYESALALDVDRWVAASIGSLRDAIPLARPAQEQMVPHVTVLFLGQMPGSRLLSLHDAFCVFGGRTVGARLGPLAMFRLADGSANLHVTLDAPGLRTLHDEARKLCAEEAWDPQTDYVGDKYTPHLTVYDRVDLDAFPPEAVEWAPASEQVMLVNPHLMVREVLSAP